MQTTPLKLLLLSAVLFLASCGYDDNGDGFGSEISSDQADPDELASTADALNSTIYDRARAYAASHPLRDGASWNQWCASLVWRFGQCPASSVRPSAIDAYYHSSIVSTDASRAPTGAIHYWAIGQYGHVGVDLNGGGQQVFMATYKLAASWGNAIGINSVGGYSAATGARYLGWAMDYSGCRIAGGGQAPGGGGGGGSSCLNLPDAATQARVQAGLALKGRYSGPIDGALGPNGFKGIQTTIRNVGYTGPIDGAIGPVGCRYIQVYAQRFGDYGGPVDGVLGPNSWRGLALGLERP